jgi:hypothetical protein
MRKGLAVRRPASAWVVALAAAGCGMIGPADGPKADLERNQRLWAEQRPNAYVYVVERQCFCPSEARGPVRVRVVDGVTTSRVYVDSGDSVPAAMAEGFPSVAGLFEFIHDAMERDPAELRVTYDTSTGVPLSIFVDYSREMADEEMGYEVRDEPAPAGPEPAPADGA